MSTRARIWDSPNFSFQLDPPWPAGFQSQIGPRKGASPEELRAAYQRGRAARIAKGDTGTIAGLSKASTDRSADHQARLAALGRGAT